MSFSQNNEEAVIAKYFADHPVTSPGKPLRVLDIGAWSGEALSNSRRLILDGAEAVLVEPAAGPFLALMRLYKDNPRVTLVNSFVSAHSEGDALIRFHQTEDAVSTADETVHAAWASVVPYRESFVASVPIFQLGCQFGFAYDLLTLDTEGETLNLFRELVRDCSWNFRCVCVEHAAGGVTHADEMVALATTRGWRELARNGENLIFGE